MSEHEELHWWGYLHTAGTVQVKRWHGDPMDLSEAYESDFVSRVVRPFIAPNREEAIRIVTQQTLPFVKSP